MQDPPDTNHKRCAARTNVPGAFSVSIVCVDKDECSSPSPSTTLRAATPRAAPRNGHTKSCHESMGQPSLTLSSKDEPRGPNQNRSTSASGNGNSEKYHRSSLDQPPRDPGLPERRFRCTLDHPDLALSAYLDDRSRATCADSFQPNC